MSAWTRLPGQWRSCAQEHRERHAAVLSGGLGVEQILADAAGDERLDEREDDEAGADGDGQPGLPPRVARRDRRA